MKNVTFITGNQGKADFLAAHIGKHIEHKKLELDEIQSLDLIEITEHKARQAYNIIKAPVLVEDAGLVFNELNALPGPFIKWYEKALGLEKICRVVDGLKTRGSKISVCFIYYDGNKIEPFIGSLEGSISYQPRGTNGFGFDPIFIPAGHKKTLAEMSDEELEKHSLRTTTVYPQIKEFLKELDNK